MCYHKTLTDNDVKKEKVAKVLELDTTLASCPPEKYFKLNEVQFGKVNGEFCSIDGCENLNLEDNK